MKYGTILHNPGAGDEEHEEEILMQLLEKNGFSCRYLSVKEKNWKKFDFQTDFLIVAGGDGTVRKVVKALLDRKMIAKTWPLALLPLGTANNIAKTLQLNEDTEANIRAWHQYKLKRYDVGCVYYKKKSLFFLESFGYGLFPNLMLEMHQRFKEDAETPEAKLQAALSLLHQLALSYKPRYCQLTIDGVDHSGKYMLVEVMNTQSIGPNLLLAPDADPGDGLLDVVVVPEQDKKKFARYIKDKINGDEDSYTFQKSRGSNIVASWDGTHIHIDDEMLKLDNDQEIQIETKKGMLEFIVT